ncbi:putative quinol monooxygenase [Algoriphagus pacificus]|uniref:Antibiotic biosynthesis monooxygenase n=1 Tax=Algoriphagus pacificus TaxID=2811234 RepID=A0ABS3CKX6_9BACT|nr:antibiotic biosynthesis monooxygenase family protein [Algoriphagus pacificus]MBN7816880.1 antibiotic biosynthesis monooxygenase [Algoriphagus pacificus]
MKVFSLLIFMLMVQHVAVYSQDNVDQIPEEKSNIDSTFNSPHPAEKHLIRISEIEIFPEFLDEYISILKEESNASVNNEPGVISIFPLVQKENPTQIRILEFYQNQEAYQSHIASEHFQYYKKSTLHMVKELKLVDMNVIDPSAMSLIFQKLK